MSWIELSINTTDEAVDWVRTLLATAEYEGDLYITKYSEPDPSQSGDRAVEPSAWAFTIRFYLPYSPSDRTHVEKAVEKIDRSISPLQRIGLTAELEATVVEEKPAQDAETRSSGHRIGQHFVVLPADAPDLPETNEISLRLKHSLAFGSGLHPTTILSLRLLERHLVPAMDVLDLGSGSGILSVAMAKLGAKVLAIDNDSVAVQATQEAIADNQVADKVTAMQGSLGHGSSLGHWMGGDIAEAVPAIEADASFDLITANLMAWIQIALASDFQRSLRRTDAHPGILINAGFTVDHEPEVTAALTEAGFEAIDREQLNEWVGLVHRLKA